MDNLMSDGSDKMYLQPLLDLNQRITRPGKRHLPSSERITADCFQTFKQHERRSRGVQEIYETIEGRRWG